MPKVAAFIEAADVPYGADTLHGSGFLAAIDRQRKRKLGGVHVLSETGFLHEVVHDFLVCLGESDCFLVFRPTRDALLTA